MSLINNFRNSMNGVEANSKDEGPCTAEGTELIRTAISDIKASYNLKQIDEEGLEFSQTYGFSYDAEFKYHFCQINMKIRDKGANRTIRMEVSITGIFKMDGVAVPNDVKKQMVEMVYPELKEFIISLTSIAFEYPVEPPELVIDEQELEKCKVTQ
ncbi:MAG: hypothetical protein LKJ83_03405 [Eubacteriaceae bacterium]|nr:hypothetical protein [Eubacteriaceae bacterium]